MQTKPDGRGSSSWTPEGVGGPCPGTAGEKGSCQRQAGPSSEKTEGLQQPKAGPGPEIGPASPPGDHWAGRAGHLVGRWAPQVAGKQALRALDAFPRAQSVTHSGKSPIPQVSVFVTVRRKLRQK